MIRAIVLEAAKSALEKRIIRKREKALKPIEAEAERRLKGYWQNQSKAFLKEFKAFKPLYPVVSEGATIADIAPIFAKVFALTKEEGDTILEDIATASLVAGADNALQELGAVISFDVTNPFAIEFLSKRGAERVVLINATTEAGIKRIVTEAGLNGWSWQRTANMIGDEFKSFYDPPLFGRGPKRFRTRAQLVAVTEAAIGYGEGQRQAAKQIQDKGIPMEKRWSGPNDDITSEACESNIKAGWIDIDALFPAGDMQEPNHPGCRHACVYRIKKG